MPEPGAGSCPTDIRRGDRRIGLTAEVRRLRQFEQLAAPVVTASMTLATQ